MSETETLLDKDGKPFSETEMTEMMWNEYETGGIDTMGTGITPFDPAGPPAPPTRKGPPAFEPERGAPLDPHEMDYKAEPDGLAAEPEDIANLKRALTEFNEANSFRDIESIGPSEGIGVSATGELWIKPAAFKAWLQRLTTGAVLGQLIVGPVLSAVDGLVPGVGTMVGTGINVFGMLTTGDPTGLLIQAGLAVYRMYQEQEKKRKENLTPDADRGKKLGYVREGNKWVPAVFSTRGQDIGIGSHDNTVIAQTGDDIIFRYVGGLYGVGGVDGEWQPWVRNKDGSAVQEKMLRMTDNEYENEIVKTAKGTAFERKWHVDEARDADDSEKPYARYGSKDLVDNFDMLRNWYMLDPEDVAKVAAGTMPFEAYDETYYGTGADDPGLANPYETQLNDWRLVMEAMATPSGRYVDPEMKKQLTEWDLSGELRSAVNHGIYEYDPANYQQQRINALMGSSQGADKWGYNNPMYGFAGLDTMGYYDKLTSERLFYRGGLGTDAVMPENDWLLNTLFTNQIKLLQHSQRAAAEEAGFDDTYGHDPYREYHKEFFKSPTFNIPDQTEEYQPIWASLYLDTTKSMKSATSASMLTAQLDTIAGYEDRSPAQQDYLRQKAITRYWIGQIGSRGGSEELVTKMYGFHTNAFDPLKAQLNNPAFDFKRIEDDEALDDSPWVNSTGWVMPWQNAGEGIMPDDVMGMPHEGYYGGLLERLDDEAREHTSEWIAAHGKFNPNLILDGHYKSIDDADILDTTEWHDTDDHEDDPDSKPDTELTPDEILAGLKSDDGTGWIDPEGYWGSDGLWYTGEGPAKKPGDPGVPPVPKPPAVTPPAPKPPAVTPPAPKPPVVVPPYVYGTTPYVAPKPHGRVVPFGPPGGVAATTVASGHAHISSFMPTFRTPPHVKPSALIPEHHDLGYIKSMEHHSIKVV